MNVQTGGESAGVIHDKQAGLADADRRINSLHEAVIHTAAEGICVCQASAESPFVAFTVWNERMLEITGYTREEINRLGWYQTVYPDPDMQRQAQERMARMQAGHQLRGEEWEIRCKDGSRRVLAISTSFVEIDEGSRGVVALMQDVTERRRAEEALRASEKKYRDLVETSNDLIWSVDAAGRWTFVNRKAAKRIHGYEPEEMLGRPFTDFQPTYQVDKDLAVFEEIKRGTPYFQYETTHIRKNGSPVSLSFNAIVLRDEQGQVVGTTGTASDITERKRAEAALARNFGLLHAIVEGTTDVVYVKDTEGKYLLVNSAGARGMGKTIAEVIGQDDAALFAAETARLIMSGDRRIMATGETATFEETLEHAVGRRVYSTTKAPYRDLDGQVIGVIGISRDITPEKLAERSLRESRERLRAMFDAEPECVKLIGGDGRVLEMNAAGLGMIEADSAEEILGQPVLAMIVTEHRDRFLAMHERVCQGYKETLEFEIIGLRGTRRWMETHAVPLACGPDGRFAQLAISRDITRQKLMNDRLAEQQAQLAHVSRLSVMGEMVAGIAHEIAQPLAAVSSFAAACSLLLDRGDAAGKLPDVRSYVRQIGEQADRGGQIIHRLRLFIRRTEPRRSRCDLAQLVRESLELIAPELRRHQTKVCHEPPMSSAEVAGAMVNVDPVQIQQVVVNLVKNAFEAMSDNPPDARRITIATTLTDSEARIEVRDQGPGLPANRERLFSAFFTTKPQGMGMGLAICRTIVEAHGGRIGASPNSPRGAVFYFTLPPG